MKHNNDYVIIFDVFGVLLTRGFQSSSCILSSLLKKDISEIKPVYERWEIPFDLGALSEKRFWELIQQDLGTSVDWESLNKAVLNSYMPIEGSIELLKKCSWTTQIFLMSNTRREWFEYLDKKFCLTKYVKKAFLSYQVGIIKPNLDFYLYVTHELGRESHQIIFIDDNIENIRVALSYGWIAHQFIDSETAMNFISQYIDLS